MRGAAYLEVASKGAAFLACSGYERQGLKQLSCGESEETAFLVMSKKWQLSW
jgi:hypothetical protein